MTTTKYLISLILINALVIIISLTEKYWWANDSLWHLSHFNPFIIILTPLAGALLWLGIIVVNLKYQLPRPTKNSTVNIILAVTAACIILFTTGVLLNFTGMLLAALSLFLIVVFALLQNHNRTFFYPFAGTIVALPIVYLLTHQYKLDRLMRILTGTDNETLDFIINSNANQSLEQIGINTPKLFLLLFDHKFGFMPTLLLVTVIIGLWTILFIALLKKKTTQRLYKQLALFITAFFIIQALLNVFINIGVLSYTLPANLMPISTNPSYWLFFVVLILAMLKSFGVHSIIDTHTNT